MDLAPVDFDGDGELGVVCVDGFTGSPYEMRYLGARLAAAGATVRVPLLPGPGPGHGPATSPAALAPVRWQDWAALVEREAEALRARCARVAVVGQSLGGLLALAYTARRPVAAVASLAAPLWFGGASGALARWLAGPLGRWISRVPELGGSGVRDRACAPRSRATARSRPGPSASCSR